MHSISKKIKILQQAVVEKSSFINEEIGRSAQIRFSCCNCGQENVVKITPYESGFPVFQLYNNDLVLSKDELLSHKMITETQKNVLHFGELTVNNLPTLYFGAHCISCDAKYIGVFSYGEKQPGLTVLTVSGVWQYEEVI